MHTEEINKKRIDNIYQIIFKMADGNFAYRIPRTTRDDMLEALTILVNWLAEEMEASLFHIDYVNPHATYHYAIQCTYLLNKEGVINDFSPDIPDLLGMDPSKLVGIHFSKLLEKKSQELWLTTKKLLQQRKINHTSLFLNFTTAKKITLSARCNIHWLFHRKKIMVGLFKAIITENPDPIQNNKQKRNPKIINKQDRQILQLVYDYILAHDDNTSFPTLRNLAKNFGTNEFKLKIGFRHLFKTSIYRLYTDQRLKKAQLLIKHTTLPLKEIAFLCGYTTYPNFSKAFKIKFDCTPNSIHRSSSN